MQFFSTLPAETQQEALALINANANTLAIFEVYATLPEVDEPKTTEECRLPERPELALDEMPLFFGDYEAMDDINWPSDEPVVIDDDSEAVGPQDWREADQWFGKDNAAESTAESAVSAPQSAESASAESHTNTMENTPVSAAESADAVELKGKIIEFKLDTSAADACEGVDGIDSSLNACVLSVSAADACEGADGNDAVVSAAQSADCGVVSSHDDAAEVDAEAAEVAAEVAEAVRSLDTVVQCDTRPQVLLDIESMTETEANILMRHVTAAEFYASMPLSDFLDGRTIEHTPEALLGDEVLDLRVESLWQPADEVNLRYYEMMHRMRRLIDSHRCLLFEEVRALTGYDCNDEIFEAIKDVHGNPMDRAHYLQMSRHDRLHQAARAWIKKAKAIDARRRDRGYGGY